MSEEDCKEHCLVKAFFIFEIHLKVELPWKDFNLGSLYACIKLFIKCFQYFLCGKDFFIHMYIISITNSYHLCMRDIIKSQVKNHMIIRLPFWIDLIIFDNSYDITKKIRNRWPNMRVRPGIRLDISIKDFIIKFCNENSVQLV